MKKLLKVAGAIAAIGAGVAGGLFIYSKIKSKKKVYVRVRVKTKNGYTVWSNPKSVKVK